MKIGDHPIWRWARIRAGRTWSDQDLSVPGVPSARRRTSLTSSARTGGRSHGIPSGWPPAVSATRRADRGGATRSGGGAPDGPCDGPVPAVVGSAGMTPDEGTYVRYDHVLTGGVLAAEAAAAAALAIGEDLGTVDPWIRDYLAAHGILGTSMLWFERRDDGTPLPPGAWRRNSLAAVGTHDMPPAAAFLTGEHVALRADLACSLSRKRPNGPRPTPPWPRGWRAGTRGTAHPAASALAGAGGRAVRLPGPDARRPDRRLAAGHGGPAAAAERARHDGRVSQLADTAGRRRGQPVFLEDLAAHAGVRANADAVSGRLRVSRIAPGRPAWLAGRPGV